MNYPVFESDERVREEPEYVSRLRWRAERRCRRLNVDLFSPFYRFGTVQADDGRWEVWAFQNIARPR